MTAPEVALGVFVAIRSGDLAALAGLLAEHPGLASEPLGGRFGTRTPLHVTADWPGYFPNGPPDEQRSTSSAGARN